MTTTKNQMTEILRTESNQARDFRREIAEDVLKTSSYEPAKAYSQMVLDTLAELGSSPFVETIVNDNKTSRPKAGAAASNQYGTFSVHAASERQSRFVAKLLQTRKLDGLTERNTKVISDTQKAVAEGSLSKKLASSAIELLLVLPEIQNENTPADKASEKQVAFVKRLLAEKDLTGTTYDVPAWRDLGAADFMTKRNASQNIEALMALPSKPKASTTKPELEDGMYLLDGEIYKVQHAVHGSGNQYAKHFTTDGFEYAKGVVSRLRAEHKMSLDQAKEFGVLYGTCIVCGRTLTDEGSIEEGIGPICARKF